MSDWTPQETDKYQDHVIAHLLGTTVLGYFKGEQAIHLLLDIALIWTVFIDVQMDLMTQWLTINDLEMSDDVKRELLADVQLLHSNGRDAQGLTRITPMPIDCTIRAVEIYAQDEQRLIKVTGDQASFAIQISEATGEIHLLA